MGRTVCSHKEVCVTIKRVADSARLKEPHAEEI